VPLNANIRCEDAEDAFAVRSLNEAAFGRLDEADLVERLRAEGVILLSLVAEVRGQVIGHILFSRMWVDAADGSIAAAALAPVAVLPTHQGQGIGGQMIRRGLDELRNRGERSVIVLGRPDYYSRFGFASETARALESPFPPDAFMATELSLNALAGIRSKVRYPLAFGL
jgi:putative acetyltransferase